MIITNNTYVHAVFFTGCDEVDWMAQVFREGDGPWRGVYRFRYHKDDKVFDSDDRKSWYNLEAPDGSEGSLRKLMQGMRTVCEMTAKMRCGGAPAEEVTIEGGPEVYFKVMSQQPWCSIRVEVPDDKEG